MGMACRKALLKLLIIDTKKDVEQANLNPACGLYFYNDEGMLPVDALDSVPSLGREFQRVGVIVFCHHNKESADKPILRNREQKRVHLRLLPNHICLADIWM